MQVKALKCHLLRLRAKLHLVRLWLKDEALESCKMKCNILYLRFLKSYFCWDIRSQHSVRQHLLLPLDSCLTRNWEARLPSILSSNSTGWHLGEYKPPLNALSNFWCMPSMNYNLNQLYIHPVPLVFMQRYYSLSLGSSDTLHLHIFVFY